MGLLDAVSGATGIASMVPGMEMLGVVSQGIELAKSLFDKGDVQGTQDILKFVSDIVSSHILTNHSRHVVPHRCRHH